MNVRVCKATRNITSSLEEAAFLGVAALVAKVAEATVPRAMAGAAAYAARSALSVLFDSCAAAAAAARTGAASCLR